MKTAPVQRSLKEKQRQEREHLILQVAEEVLLEKGYYDTSMDEIAVRVGIAKGTLYLHFPGKEDLVLAIFARDMQSFVQDMDNATAGKPSAQAKIEALLRFMYTGIFSKRAQLLSMILNSVDMQHLFAEKGTCLRDLWNTFAEKLTAILEEGKAAGEFDTTIPTRIMLYTFFGLLSPRNFERIIKEEHLSADDLVTYVERVYFGGIASKK